MAGVPSTSQKPMLARLVRELPAGDMIYEPKWDGFRCLVFRDGAAVDMRSRHGRPLARYFPELAAAFSAMPATRFAADGEILVLTEGRFDFAQLMARLHPAPARVRELARRTPAIFVAFDLLAAGGDDLRGLAFADRRARLERLLEGVAPPVFITPASSDRDVAARWLARFRGGGLDGVVAKPRELRYEGGRRAMLKVKHERTAECVVAGVRATADPPEIWSLMLGLYGAGDRLEHVGVASSFSRAVRRRLVDELEPLVTALEGHPWEHGFLLAGGPTGRLKGAAGRWHPGMTMDWVPLRPQRVCEVSLTQVDGLRLRHPAKLVRWRPDRDPLSCRVDQLEEPAAAPDQLLAA
jgi:ATP-dependent DNA ligase